MSRLFILNQAMARDTAIDRWMEARPGSLGGIAHQWFQAMRASDDKFVVCLHDGYPTTCMDNSAFAYVGLFAAHVNIGFFSW